MGVDPPGYRDHAGGLRRAGMVKPVRLQYRRAGFWLSGHVDARVRQRDRITRHVECERRTLKLMINVPTRLLQIGHPGAEERMHSNLRALELCREPRNSAGDLV